MMGFRTPNIDRIAEKAPSSPTPTRSRAARRAVRHSSPASRRSAPVSPGRAARRSGRALGQDPTIAELLKAHGYATGQFGKNHLGDRNEFFPPCTASMNSSATSTTSTPKRSRRTRTIRRTRRSRRNSARAASSSASPRPPRRRARTRASANGQAALRGHRPAQHQAHADHRRRGHGRDAGFHRPPEASAEKPWFAWFNTSRMHIWTHLKPEPEGKWHRRLAPTARSNMTRTSASSLPSSTSRHRRQHHRHLLDRQARALRWPDGGTTPFRNEKNSNWEGGYRVPMRPPPARRRQAEHRDQRRRLARRLLPTLLAAVGRLM